MDTPFEVNTKYSSEKGDILFDPTVFRQLVGSLIYLTITRLDISFAIQQVSQFMHSPAISILLLFIVSFTIFEAHLITDCSFLLALLFVLMLLVMRTRLDVLTLDDLSRGGVCFLVILLED